MKAIPECLVLVASALALSGPTAPKPIQAGTLPIVIDRSAEVAALKAELETLRAELVQSKSALSSRQVVPPSTVPADTVTDATAGGGTVVCGPGGRRVVAAGSVSNGSRVRVFQGGPVRRLFSGRPRLFGRH